MTISGELGRFRASDGYEFYYRRWDASGRPRARLVFVHGIRSHAGWYQASCQRLGERGYEVLFLDRRGAGLNTAHRADAPSFRRLLDDLGEFLRDLRRSRPALPIVLVGISWGGKLAVGLPYRRPGLVHGLALLCPGLAPQVTPPFLQRLAIARARLLNPQRLFPIPLNDPDLFTTSPQWQQFIAQDPHGLRQATARFLFASFALDIYLRRAARRVTLPTLLMLAGEDRIIDNARTQAMVERFPSPDRTVITYPGAHHTLEFEGDGHPWFEDLCGWVEQRLV